MTILKISFMLRSPSVGWDYKSANKRALSDDIAIALEKISSPAKPVHDIKGSVQFNFYVTTESDAEQQKAAAKKILEALIADEKARGMIIVSVTEPGKDEIEKLRQKVNTEDNVEFWAAVQKCEKPSNKKTVEKPKEELAAEVTEEENEPVTEKEVKAEKKAEKDPPKKERPTLAETAVKLRELKNVLLKEVKGQRHAVDEVLQGVFEGEMFAFDNPKRKGPLATFLFTGPSGVGKTLLAQTLGDMLGRKCKIIDMSEFSDNLANGKFNGEYNHPAVVTEFARKNPDGIIIFDEVEKAHINTIHLFLQILDGARLMDHHIKKEVSFRNNIIIMTTNAGKALYEDTTVFDLSSVPRSVILDGLRKDINPQTHEPFFPECITTRMANGRVILFNHLEPYALLEIIKAEISRQVQLFEASSGLKINYDPVSLSALILYHAGGAADARTLTGLARDIVSRELQEVVMQLLDKDAESLGKLREITLTIETQETEEIGNLFTSHERMQAVVMTETEAELFESATAKINVDFHIAADEDYFKRRIRGVADYVLLDPLFGNCEKDRIPNDIEDIDSLGMKMFEYMREYTPDIPVYILDTTGKVRSYDTLMARGARGVIRADSADGEGFCTALRELAFGALVNNATFSLGRSNKFLNFNCAQYIISDSCAVVSFERLQLKSAPEAGDGSSIIKKGENSNLRFDDIIGCKLAKEALSDYAKMLENPREMALKGKKMPKGVLLYGPPGTGKTMLAKAMANECNATFIPTTAGAFFGSLVGETEKNIQNLFRKARKYAPSIIFVDEVDVIARARTGSTNSVHNEDALNVFLSEMDGFAVDEKRPVFVMVATNYEIEGGEGRVLDQAFVRRFNQKIRIPLPDTDDRYELIEKSLKRHGIHFGEDHEKIVMNMAKRTCGMNNADIEMINSNYARLLGDGEPDGGAYLAALDEYRFGEVNEKDPEALRQTAYHEAGHALVCRLCGVTPTFLTVVSRGDYGGYMESAGESKGTYTYRELMNRVCRSLAGRVAEIEVYGETAGNNTGASADIRHARYFMKLSLNELAMGEKLYARWTPGEIEEVMRKEYERTRQMIRDNRAILDALTDLLVEKKSLDQTQLEDFFEEMNI